MTPLLILKLLRKKIPYLNRFPGKFYQTFKEELIPIFYKNLHKIKEKGTISNSLYEDSELP